MCQNEATFESFAMNQVKNRSFVIVVPPSSCSHDMKPSDFFQNAFFCRSLALDADKALELFLGSFCE